MKKNSGLSLIELLVAIALSSVIIAGVIQVFLSNRQAFNMNESMVRVQENGRYAIEFLANAIRQSGSYGCVPYYNRTEENIKSSNLDIVESEFLDINGNNTNGAATPSWFDDPDTIKLLRALDNSVFVTSINENAVDDTTLEINVTSGGTFVEGSNLLLSNCQTADFISADKNTTDTKIFDEASELRRDFYDRQDIQTEMFEVEFLEYRVDNAVLQIRVDDGAWQDFVPGIENIQFKYGIDTDGDFVADHFDEVDDVDLTQLGLSDSLVAIHVSVLTVTDSANVVSQPQEDISYNDKELDAVAGDLRLRRVFETVVTFRSRMI